MIWGDSVDPCPEIITPKMTTVRNFIQSLIKPSHLRFLMALSQRIDRVTDVIGSWSTWLVLATIAVGFYNVVARYIGRLVGLKLSSNALIELQWYLFSMMFFCGFAYILKHAENVRVDFLYSNWTERQRSLVDFWGTVLFLIPFCILGWCVAIDPVLDSWGYLPDGTWGTWEVSPDADGLPRAPIKTMILFAFVTLLAQAVSQAIKYLAVLKGYATAAAILQPDVEKLPLE
jgi:TRAP-type mannitol/chloroaromatic compound transport system permease small subunit